MLALKQTIKDISKAKKNYTIRNGRGVRNKQTELQQ